MDLVTMPSKWNIQYHVNNWTTHHGKVHGASIQSNGAFSSFFSMPKGPYLYSPPSGNLNGAQTPQGRV